MYFTSAKCSENAMLTMLFAKCSENTVLTILTALSNSLKMDHTFINLDYNVNHFHFLTFLVCFIFVGLILHDSLFKKTHTHIHACIQTLIHTYTYLISNSFNDQSCLMAHQ